MRIYRLAQIFEQKLQAQGGLLDDPPAPAKIIESVKQDLLNAYRSHIDVKTAKYPVLKMLADTGEEFSALIIAHMTELAANIDELGAKPSDLFKKVNKLLGIINQAHTALANKKIPVLHGSQERMQRESERNFVNHVGSKFSTTLRYLSSTLVKCAKVLQRFLPKETALEGGAVSQVRKPLSKEKLRMFMLTPAAQAYGLDNMDVMTKVLEEPELREMLTTVINAVDRGHVPRDGSDISEIAKTIKKRIQEKKQTNLTELEVEKSAPPAVSLFEEGE
jgi:hypothetical protein